MQLRSLCGILTVLTAFPSTGSSGQFQRFDGWYNNLDNPSWGSIGDEIMRKVEPLYEDMTYLPYKGRPNPRDISNKIFAGPSGLPSFANRTVLFTYFGQMISAEIVSASEPSCPMELIKIPIPSDDIQYRKNSSDHEFLPFTRADYSKNTGQAPNRPRKQVNRVSSYIDGGFLYGQGQVWSACMRAYTHGKLAMMEAEPGYPASNHMQLPYYNNRFYGHAPDNKVDDLWMLGHPHAHQHPGLTSIALLWFRYHNLMAETFHAQHPDWPDEALFSHTRRWVIGVMQNVIMYEWLPALLNSSIPEYSGYDSCTTPAISAVFEAAAFRSVHSYVPPAIYTRDTRCSFNTSLRLCNSFFRSQDLIQESGLESFILGMTSQIGEREDHVIIDDLRGNCFGPRHFSRRDLVTLTIMRGRDHGLPDYNSVRRAYRLPPVTNWSDINPELYDSNPEIFEELRRLYKDNINNLDVYPAGMLESTSSGPGPLFTKIMKEQFMRLRDGDRFWFERTGTKHSLSEDEVAAVRNVTLADVIRHVLSLEPEHVQDNVFFWKAGDPCAQPFQAREATLEPCTPHEAFDYFAGSELAYIAAFTFLGLVPFMCVLVAVVIAKVKRWRMNRQKQSKKGTSSRPRSTLTKYSGLVPANEWLGRQAPMTEVTVGVDNEQHRIVLLSDDKLVLVTDTEEETKGVLDNLEALAALANKPLHRHNCARDYIYDKAVTKAKRHRLLLKFFRSIYAEAYNLKELQPTEELEINQCKEIVSCELSRSEFAEALALKQDSLFVNQMFSIIDRDQNGYISFRELLYAVLLFTKGSCEDKMRLLFTMYDVDKSGTLSKKEVTAMIKSMMDIANAQLKPEELEGLVSKMFAQAGANRRLSLKFEDFRDVLVDRLDIMWDVCLDFKGTKICMPKSKLQKSDHTDKVSRSPTGTLTHRQNITEQTPGHRTKAAIVLHKATHYIENHRQHIFYLLLFFCTCGIIFAERFYYYDVETEHLGFRSIAGSGVSLTRGAAAVISFTFSLLLLTMCRNTITLLRGTFINLYLPFDSHVTFHKLVAYTALVFSVTHVLGYCFNFYNIATQPVEYLCIFNEVYLKDDFLPKINFWLFGNLVGMTGIFLVICIAIIYVFATQTSRKYIFNAFWITHKLIYILYLLILLHGCSRVIQDPMFWYYFIGPAALFAVDKTVSLARQKREIKVIDAELLPSAVTLIEFKRPHNFEYMSGQWVRLAVESLGREEYHAFTLTSAPHEDSLSAHIRAVGPWTHNIRSIFDPKVLCDRPFPTAYIDGPYGAGQQDWFKYEVSVLVGGGIGVTPYASILKDFVHMTSIKNTFRVKCQKLYFVWVTGSQKHFEWFIDILKKVEERDVKSIVETHIFITQMFHEFDLRTTMLYLCEEHFQKMAGRSMFTGLAATTHFGRPNFQNILDAVREKHPRVRKVGVFSCGPPGLTKGVQKACYSTSAKTRFEHHFENF